MSPLDDIAHYLVLGTFCYQPCRDEVLHQLQLDNLLPGEEEDNHHGDAGGVGWGVPGAAVNLGLPAQVREDKDEEELEDKKNAWRKLLCPWCLTVLPPTP